MFQVLPQVQMIWVTRFHQIRVLPLMDYRNKAQLPKVLVQWLCFPGQQTNLRVVQAKKLHSSLEGQIRVLLKKCRVLAGMEPGHIGSRGLNNMSHHVPLFSLDTSRVVALLERSINKKQEPLDVIAGLFEDSMSSKSPLDILSLENNYHPTNRDDFQLIKDFIFRQSDALRGRGGYSSNATAGSVAGVGMVAAAAAAAAVSAAAGNQLMFLISLVLINGCP